ncbi:hypothetical protein BGX33_002652 [Mortierella sp. NVP41]|nr:hypothetical protein BGX33_002652 [Mortierella sp. NVP41]
MTDSVSRNIVKYHDVEFADICAIEFPSWTGRESIEAYVAGLRGLLPTDDAKQALDILLRPKVIQAIAERLGGRFRPAITAIERIIADGDPDGWQGAIDETEAELVLYDLRRKRGNLCSELARAKMAAPRYLTNFKEPRIVLEALRLLLFHRRMFGVDSLVIRKAVPLLVDHDFGRITIGTARGWDWKRTIVDEPFVLKAAENFFKERDPGFLADMESWTRGSDKALEHGLG